MMWLLGWFCLICGGGAGLVGLCILFKNLIGSLFQSDADEVMWRIMMALMGTAIGAGSCAGLIGLGGTILGWW